MEWIREIGKAILLVVLQVLLFNHLQIASWGYPMVYVLILMSIPVRIPRWVEMMIGAVVGMVFDLWSYSLGVHMAACIAFSFLRPILLNNLAQDLERVKGEVNSRSIGRIEYTKCLVFLVLTHHFMVFALEAWSWHNWWMVLLQTIISSALTILIILGYEIFRK